MVMAAAGIECCRVAKRGCVEVAAEDGGAVTGPSDLREAGREGRHMQCLLPGRVIGWAITGPADLREGGGERQIQCVR